MIQTQDFNESDRIYRIDKFIVPNHARNGFIDKVHRTHEFLRTLPGFLQDSVLEQTSGPGEFNFVTIVVWDSAKSLENAKQVVMARHKEMGFNPQDNVCEARHQGGPCQL